MRAFKSQSQKGNIYLEKEESEPELIELKIKDLDLSCMVRGGWDFKVSINQDYRGDIREYFSESKDF